MAKSKLRIFTPLLAGLFVFLLLMALFVAMGFAPFGDNSLAIADADIQYLDFFAYFKDLLSGQADVAYTFGKGLGGGGIAVLSYYLLSPLNLLIVFYDKADLISFFHLAVAFKMSLAAIACAIFLQGKFQEEINRRGRPAFLLVALLSVCYALSQWFIAQSSNLMWLDGAYMLPLILLGVHRFVKRGKLDWLLPLAVGLSIIFNWYTGGINCLFSAVWFAFEFFTQTRPGFKPALRAILRYLALMFIGVLISAAVFFPTVGAMLNSGRGQLDLSLLRDFSLRGNPLSAVTNYHLGAVSSTTSVCLFAGALVGLGVLGYFLSKHFNKTQKLAAATLILIILLMFYWNPGFLVFSLFKDANSYYYRYAYVAIFALVALAADFYFAAEWRKPNLLRARVLYALLVVVVLGEMGLETELQLAKFHWSDAGEYQAYVSAMSKTSSALKTLDSGAYRVNQTYTRHPSDRGVGPGLTANYNEPLAFGYWGLSSYTSSPDDRQMTFLDKSGYLTGSVNMNVVDTSLLAVDSLLGVKYVLSDYAINGLVPTSIDKVYQNPFALPLAFAYSANDFETETEAWTGMGSVNPFEYQNRLFSKLLGAETKLYRPVSSSLERSEGKLSYTLQIPEGNFAVYANVPWSEPVESALFNANGAYEIGYAMWLSPSALCVPTTPGDTSAVVEISGADVSHFRLGAEQFYVLDLDALSAATTKLRQNQPASVIIENGSAHFSVSADDDNQILFTSIPVDGRWVVTRNGERIEPEIFADAFYQIPLAAGDNEIEMVYNVKYDKLGFAGSVAGLLALAAIATNFSVCIALVVASDKSPRHSRRSRNKHN